MGNKVGLILGAGSARGLANIGVLKVLEKNQIKVDFLAGTSMGAMVGAFYAAGIGAEALEEIATGVDLKLMAQLFAPTLSASGLINGKRIEDFTRSFLKNLTFENLKIPFAAVATDIRTGEEIVLEKGKLVKAVRASISIPVIFTPVRYGDRFLVDGGLVNPVPVSVARRAGVDIVIAVNVVGKPSLGSFDERSDHLASRSKPGGEVGSLNALHQMALQFTKESTWPKAKEIHAFLTNIAGKETKSGPPHMIDISMQTFSIYEYEIARLKLLQDPPDVLIEPDVSNIKARDFHRATEIIQLGAKAARKALPDILKAIS